MAWWLVAACAVLLGPLHTEGAPADAGVGYKNGDFALEGYLYSPKGEGKAPAVVVLPDWDGINAYEQKRAQMLADLGYVGFAADIYGKDKHEVTDMQERIKLTTMYRSDPKLFNSRIQAAVETVRNLTEVDPTRVAVIGYCFGGTGVLNYAISGANVSGVVSFHGGLTQRMMVDNKTAIPAKVLVLSGGDDDAHSDVAKLENELNAVNTTWEMTRYSKVVHGFTAPGPGYNKRADERSWESMKLFLVELFNPKSHSVQPTSPPASVAGVKTVDYKDGDFELAGFLAQPEVMARSGEKVPAVVVVPDWDGLNDYEKKRVQMFADLGLVGFGADIYGKGKHEVTDVQERIKLTSMYRGDPKLFNQRIQAAIKTVLAQPNVDPNRIALVGYCFGGTGVLNYAISGKSDVKGVISFHGGLTKRMMVQNGTNITASILLLSGGSDDAQTDINALELELNSVNATWEMTRYSGVPHAFTVWDAQGAYTPRADMRSWASMEDFLSTLFGLDLRSPEPMPSDGPAFFDFLDEMGLEW